MHGLPLLFLALTLGACGSATANVLSETAGSLDEIKSGVVDVQLVAEGESDAGPAEAGFTLTGPFTMPDPGELPTADIEYTKFGDEESTGRFVSTSEAAYVETDDGTVYELPPEMTAGLIGTEESGNPFDLVELESWVEEAELEEDTSYSGVDTNKVTANPDVVAALNDIFEVARALGAAEQDFPPIEGSAADDLRSAVSSSSLVLHAGREDDLLRHVAIDIEWAPQETPELGDVLGEPGTREFHFEFSIADVNEPVEIEAPTDAVPFEG
jgi:hypothetical protein